MITLLPMVNEASLIPLTLKEDLSMSALNSALNKKPDDISFEAWTKLDCSHLITTKDGFVWAHIIYQTMAFDLWAELFLEYNSNNNETTEANKDQGSST